MKIAPIGMGPAKPPENPKLRAVAKEYEALFVNQMIEAMRKTVTKGGLVPEGQGEKVYQGMLDQEYAKSISSQGELGLSNVIYQQLVRTYGR